MMREATKKSKIFIIFIVAGVLSTTTHYLLMLALIKSGMNPVISTSIGALAGAITGYSLNKKFTFNVKVSHRVALPKYFISAAVGLISNNLIFIILLSKLYLSIWTAQIIATGATFIFNFLCNKNWTFRENYVKAKK